MEKKPICSTQQATPRKGEEWVKSRVVKTMDKIVAHSTYLGKLSGRDTYSLRIPYGTLLYMVIHSKPEKQCIMAHETPETGPPYHPFEWTLLGVNDFCERYGENLPVEFEIVSQRVYGQPRLKKPAELKGIQPSFILKRLKQTHQCFILSNDIWIKHNSFGSIPWYPPNAEDVGKPNEYLMPKYFGTSFSARRIYGDSYGEIMLRGQAWLRFYNIVPFLTQHGCNMHTIHGVIMSMANCLNQPWTDLYYQGWERFVEEMVHKALLTINQKEAGVI